MTHSPARFQDQRIQGVSSPLSPSFAALSREGGEGAGGGEWKGSPQLEQRGVKGGGWQCYRCFQPFSPFSPHLLAAGIISAIMASHAVLVTRSLLLAALAALMLSACAPRAAAVRLPPQSNAADYSCVQRNCGANGQCVKSSSGVASCVCDTGFALQADGRTCTDVCIIKNCQGSDANSTCVKNGNLATCVCKPGFALAAGKCTDTCEIQNCGVNGKCVKDSAGAASCVCDTGFALQLDGRTCTDVCIIKNCPGLDANSTCVKNGNLATCVCKTEFALANGKCTDTCEIQNCGVNGKCVKDSDGAASCVCDTGFALQSDNRTCTDVCVIKNCEGSDANSYCDKEGNVATCLCNTGYAMANGKCTGVCEIKNCGANSVCNAAGNEATCVCDQGFVLQQDGVTCNPPLKTDLDTNVDPAPGGCDPNPCTMGLSYCQPSPRGAVCLCMPGLPSFIADVIGCFGGAPCPLSCANGHCDYTSNGMPTCVCDPGFVLQPDGTTCLQAVDACEGNCVPGKSHCVTMPEGSVCVCDPGNTINCLP
ncbi:unnamed protein product, partial [Closterium sp. Naga37s-1]